MRKEEVVEKLNSVLSNLIGCHIGTDHIHTDEQGWFYYIPKESLQENHPLILNHYRGPLFVVIPVKDMERLKEEVIAVNDYVNNSVWNFGYFWGGGSLLDGIKWQPLEEKGIHDTQKIARYLRILLCRTSTHSSGYVPDEKHCSSCLIQRCPYSRYKFKYAGSSWRNEVTERDDRIALYSAIKERVEKRFGFNVNSCMVNSLTETVCIFPHHYKDTVEVYLPQALLIDMMYNPGKYDTEKVAEELKMEIGVPWHYEGEKFVEAQRYEITEVTTTESFYEIWKEQCPYVAHFWFNQN